MGDGAADDGRGIRHSPSILRQSVVAGKPQGNRQAFWKPSQSRSKSLFGVAGLTQSWIPQHALAAAFEFSVQAK